MVSLSCLSGVAKISAVTLSTASTITRSIWQ